MAGARDSIRRMRSRGDGGSGRRSASRRAVGAFAFSVMRERRSPAQGYVGEQPRGKERRGGMGRAPAG